MSDWRLPSQSEVDDYFIRFDSWDHSGNNDLPSTEKLIAPQNRVTTVALVRGPGLHILFLK